ncbi:MAG TPA: tape measure protein [Candidatus Butyricicoccus avistercoris]|uniref:Tape measure protein n=1 Tax=Candidatus Butyricicoccus avistercoris TaxID=2838518 RepID=A0A9D1PIT5_9FIRM|nr:tape measure protein [Candidatus Butyricicoccus avistercoris]
MPDVSIAVSVRNNASRELGNISRSTQVLENDIESLSRELDTLRNQRVTLRTNIDEIKKELQAARREFDGTEQSVQRLQNANLYMDTITEQLNDVSRAARNAQRDLAAADDELSRSRAGGGIASGVDIDDGVNGSTNSLISRLGEAGVWSYAGDILSNTSQTLVSSAYGSNAGTMFGSVISGATSGAALGTMVGGPGIGTAVGAGLGAVGGVITGATQIYEEKDDAFKDYVQTQTENQLSAQEESLASGSSIAAQREKDLISFGTLFGSDDIAKQYLNDVKQMASSTPFAYDDLTALSKTLSSYGFAVDKLIPTLTSIGDAGSAVGMGVDDMNELAQALGRMSQGGSITREHLDVFDDRGINATQFLANAYGVSYDAMLEKISDGEIAGQNAVNIIIDALNNNYANSMEKLAGTFDGLNSSLEDAQNELDAAMGEGYNAVRKEGLQAEMDYLSGESGQIMQEANYAIGAWKAELENSKEQYIRDAMEAMMASEEYQTAQANEDAAEMGKLMMQAQVQGMSEYNASEGAQLALESELALAGSIREDASSNTAYYNAGLRKGQEYTKGVAAGMKDSFLESAGTTTTGTTTTSKPPLPPNSNAAMIGAAFGINRVPYDDYPVRLHQGERVLTANQARQMDNGSSAANITIHMGSVTIREDADIDRIAAALVENLKIAKAVQK